jgi:tetratricopeptide (TPR) repeat protein
MSDWLDAEAHADRALEMYQRGRWAEAEAELRKALSLNPDQAEWHYNLGLTLEAAGRDSDALASYERAIQLLPEQVDPLVAAAVASNRLGRHQEAIERLERALRLDQQHEVAWAQKIDALSRLGNHDEAETTFYLAQQTLKESSAACLAAMAESLIQRGEFQRAEWCLKEAMRLEPAMPRLRARLAAVSAATNKPQRALQLYLRELRDDPGNIDTLLEYGTLLMDLGRHPEAAEKFRRVLELEPANVEAHYELGCLAMAARRFEQAHLEFELVLKLDPQFPGIHMAVGESLLRRGRIEEARERLVQEHQQLRVDSGEADSTQPSVSDLDSAGPATAGPAGASEDMRLSVDPAALGDLLLEAGEPARAVQLLELAIQRGETPDLLRQLALARFRAGDREGGSAISRRVLRLEPQCLRSMHNLALAALQEGRIRTAAGWVWRGLRINRHDADMRRLRVRVLVGLVKELWRRVLRRQRATG